MLNTANQSVPQRFGDSEYKNTLGFQQAENNSNPATATVQTETTSEDVNYNNLKISKENE